MRLAAAGLVVALTIGLAAGLGGYTFVYARGGSYLTNDPAACANCHVMEDYYRAWLVSSHRAVAVCNDCHTPHGLVPKYATKASNGFWHSFAFTTGRFPEPLQITPRNRRIAESSCYGCHAAVVEAIAPHGQGLSCVRCHGAVGHPR
ncbi:MAG TPA: cytochrome c nitrite reductase small subunit [Vicinamibacteria bacterium]|nr:cytochrome c nitrite reductase small subunit [Vicinamibacteria bacterium]